MAVYYKPQSPIQSGEDFIYPITTADQVKVDKDTRLNAVGVYLKNIDNSTDTTVYGNNATTLGGVAAEDYALKTDTAPDSSKLGGVAASDYALKTDTAPDSSKLGGKAPEYYLQPRNLLDNSDFRNPVNQRGQTSYNSAGYTIDRWTKESNTILTIADDCINIDNSANSAEEVLLQKVDSDTAAKLIGKTVTIAICTSDGTVYAKSGVVAYDVPVALIEHNGFTFQLQFFRTATSYQVARLIIWAGANISVKWVALYEGSYTAETLPPYVPKGYAAELAECQRYYLPVSEYWNMGVILTGTGYICLNIPTNIKMRISPKTIMSNPRMYHPAYDWVDLTYRTLEWHAPFYRIIFDWPSSIQASISDIVLINGVTGLSADL